MFCPRCNNEIAENVKTCPTCNFHFQEGMSYNREELVGYSPNIKKIQSHGVRQKQQNRFVFVGYAVAVIALFGIPLLYFMTKQSLLTGIIAGVIIAAFFSFFATLQIRNSKFDRTYDAEIIDKDVEKQQHKKKTLVFCKLHLKKDNGATQWVNLPYGAGSASYYAVGDVIRHHKGFLYPEKFDKSKDDRCICVNCGVVNNMKNDQCCECGIALLKYGTGKAIGRR